MTISPTDRRYVADLLRREAKHLRDNARDYARKAENTSLTYVELADYHDRAACNLHRAGVLDAVAGVVVGAGK